MQISKADLSRLIPHSGAMCLLDGVLSWSADAIACISSTHRDPANPLRHNGLLHAACGIEYVSQAMAAHGSLTNADPASVRMGYLASVRNFALHAHRLDLIADDLLVEARQVWNMDQKSLYDFNIIAGGKTVIAGRAAVSLAEAVS